MEEIVMSTALDLANYIINKCTIDNHPISNLQLQKILYCTQRKYLRLGKLAFPEDFEAWQFGPVVPEVYEKYCGFGAMPIRLKYSIDIDLDDRNIIDYIIDNKRCLMPWNLVTDVHAPGKAWDLIYNQGKGDHRVIPKILIKSNG